MTLFTDDETSSTSNISSTKDLIGAREFADQLSKICKLAGTGNKFLTKDFFSINVENRIE